MKDGPFVLVKIKNFVLCSAPILVIDCWTPFRADDGIELRCWGRVYYLRFSVNCWSRPAFLRSYHWSVKRSKLDQLPLRSTTILDPDRGKTLHSIQCFLLWHDIPVFHMLLIPLPVSLYHPRSHLRWRRLAKTTIPRSCGSYSSISQPSFRCFKVSPKPTWNCSKDRSYSI